MLPIEKTANFVIGPEKEKNIFLFVGKSIYGGAFFV